MEIREIMLYTITILSFACLAYLFFSGIPKISAMSGRQFTSITGNVVLDLQNSVKLGDKLAGRIIIEDADAYGILLLTKNNKPIIIKTFNIKDIPRDKMNPESIEMSDLADYKFEEKGKYELLFSVLDLNSNIKKEIIIK